MRVCIYGAGAMGTSCGALLTSAGVSCELVSRNRAHVAALKERGAQILLPKADIQTPVCAILPEEMRGEYDCILLTAKQRDNKQIAEFLFDFLKADGALVTLQNGLPEAELAEVFGADRVYGGVLSWGAESIADGVVKVTSDAGFRMGLGAYGKGKRVHELAVLFEKAFIVSEGNFNELRFAKLATNASFSTLSVLSGLPFGTIAKRYRKYAYRLVRETFAVARTYGCKKLPLNGHDLFRVFSFGRGALLPVAMKKYRDTRSGMLKDLHAGKRCDIDYVAGAVVAAGEKKGIECSYLSRAVELVHEIENGFAEIAPETIGLLDT